MNTSQYQAALELGCPETLIKKLLGSKEYNCAGDLIEDIWKLQDEEIDEREIQEIEVNEKDNENSANSVSTVANDNVSTTAKDSIETSTLRKETERLYRQSRCLVCHITNRTRVNLPCGHLTHCESCDKFVKRCPVPSCKHEIACTIQTYM